MALQKAHVRKNDTVMVITGKEAGKTGKVLRVIPEKGRVVVEGLNIVKRHTKPTQKNPQGGITEKPAPIALSNVMVYCKKCDKPTRVAKEAQEITKGDRVKTVYIRKCKHCGALLGDK